MSNKRNAIVAWLSVMMLAPAVGAEQLTLDGALSIAFDRSPIIRVARHSLEISRQNLLAQRSALRSKFSLFCTTLPMQRLVSFLAVSKFMMRSISSKATTPRRSTPPTCSTTPASR